MRSIHIVRTGHSVYDEEIRATINRERGYKCHLIGEIRLASNSF